MKKLPICLTRTSARKGLIKNGQWTSPISPPGWLYLAVLLDLYSRTVVGWSVRRDDESVGYASLADGLCVGKYHRAMLHHLGSQYTSKAYLDLLRGNCEINAMSGKGNCYDNACVESFFSTLEGGMCRRNVAEMEARNPYLIIEFGTIAKGSFDPGISSVHWV